MRSLILCCMLLAATSVLSVDADESAMKEKYVSASLYSKWLDTPLLLEAVEFIHRNNPNFLWTFIQEVSDMPIFSEPNSSTKWRHWSIRNIADVDNVKLINWFDSEQSNLLQWGAKKGVWSAVQYAVWFVEIVSVHQDLFTSHWNVKKSTTLFLVN